MKVITQVLAALTTVVVCSVEAKASLQGKQPHHLYIQPDMTWNVPHQIQLEAQPNSELFLQPDLVWSIPKEFQPEVLPLDPLRQRTSGQYYGFNIGYEFTKNNRFYAGIDVFLSQGREYIKVEKHRDHLVDILSASKNKCEARLGYPIQFSKFSLIPFSGIGEYLLTKGPDYELNVAYLPIGLKAAYNFEQITIGIKAEGMRYFQAWGKYDGAKESLNLWKENITGYEVSMPISFRSKSGWDASCEPYFLKLFGNEKFVGGKFSLGWRF